MRKLLLALALLLPLNAWAGKSVIICSYAFGSSSVSSGTTVDWWPTGFVEDESDEGETFVIVPAAGTFRNPTVRVLSNSVNSTTPNTVFNFEVNSTDEMDVIVNQSTDVVTDTDFVSVSQNDEINWELVVGGTSGSVSLHAMLVEFEPDNSAHTYSFIGANSTGSAARSADGVTYIATVGERQGGTTESEFQYRSSIDGTIVYFQVTSGSIQDTAGTSTFTVLINGSEPASAPSVSFTDTEDSTNKADTSRTASVSPGDLISVEWEITGSGGGNMNVEKVGMWIRTTDGEFVMASMRANGQRMNDDASYYYFSGGSPLGPEFTLQTNKEIPMPFDVEVSNLHVKSDRETGTVATHTVTVLDDSGTATALSVSFDDGETGWQEDTINTITVVAGQSMSWEIDMPLGGTNRDWNVIGVVASEVTENGGNLILVK